MFRTFEHYAERPAAAAGRRPTSQPMTPAASLSRPGAAAGFVGPGAPLLGEAPPLPPAAAAGGAAGAATAAPTASLLELSPGWAAVVELRRCEEEIRSAALRSENEELRRELARAGEVGEALEQQQQLAEDRMHELEQERYWLSERIACLHGAAPSTDASAASLAAAASEEGTSRGDATGEAERLALEEANRLLRQELQEQLEELARQRELAARAASAGDDGAAQRRAQQDVEARLAAEAAAAEAREAQRRLEAAALEAERAHVAELRQQRESRDRIICDLDDQTQALERQLRSTEERARRLAEENARLQAALGSAGSVGADSTSPAAWAAESPVDAREQPQAFVDGGSGDGPLDLPEAW